MTTVAEHVLQQKLPRENRGIASLNLDEYSNEKLPIDWEFESPAGDIIVGVLADETKEGEVIRGGIVLNRDVTRFMWRVMKITKLGPDCTDHYNVGDFVMFPNDRGLKAVSMDGQKLVFLNEERLFGRVKPTEEMVPTLREMGLLD